MNLPEYISQSVTSPQVASQLSPSGHGCTLTSALPDCFGGDNFVLLLVCAVPFYTSFQTTVETLNFVTSGKGTHLCDMFVDERQREREQEREERAYKLMSHLSVGCGRSKEHNPNFRYPFPHVFCSPCVLSSNATVDEATVEHPAQRGGADVDDLRAQGRTGAC